MINWFYLDVESIPTRDESVIDRIAEEITPPGNISKAETISAWHLEKKPALVKEAVSKTSFDGVLGSLCTIGWACDDGEPQSITWPLDVDSEAAMIYTFKTIVEPFASQAVTPVIVGHYVADFDLRMLWQRAMILGIRMPSWFPFFPRPWDRSIIDTMTTFAGAKGTIGLDRLCDALGIPGKGDFDGSMVADAWSRGEYERIGEYCRQDVERTRAVHKKMLVAMGER